MFNQYLATILRVLTNIKLMSKDSHTDKKQTVLDYMSRVQCISQDASSFPIMKVPIVEPLIKVLH